MTFDIESLKELSPPVLLLVALNAVGWAAKQSSLPNKCIPWLLLIIGGCVYPMIYDYSDMIINCRNQLAVAVLQGVCIGGAAVGVFEATKVFRKESTLNVKPPDKPVT